MVAPAKLCRNCRQKNANRSRGLCSRCYSLPYTRIKFPPQNYPQGLGLAAPAKEPEPTEHPPGSAAKVEVLAARMAAGLMLWSALDRQECGPGTRHLGRPEDEQNEAAEAA